MVESTGAANMFRERKQWYGRRHKSGPPFAMTPDLLCWKSQIWIVWLTEPSNRSFAIIAAPYGLSTTFYISLTDGQSVTVLWGWVLVSLISLCIAASLAEICAVYPTAGGVYYWSAMLCTKKYAPIASWITGWLTLVGNWTVTTSINFGGAQLILSAITLWREDYVPNAYQTVLMYWAVRSPRSCQMHCAGSCTDLEIGNARFYACKHLCK